MPVGSDRRQPQQRRNPRSAEQPPAGVAVWNHAIRVTTVHLAGSSVSTTVTLGVGEVENVADDGIQREVEGDDHRFPPPTPPSRPRSPVEPAAQDRGRRQDLPGRVVQRCASRHGLD
jgi:hypothetical protein